MLYLKILCVISFLFLNSLSNNFLFVNSQSYIDSRYNPCTNFYNYTCGKYIHEQSLIDNYSNIDTFFNFIKSSNQFHLLNFYFNSCLNFKSSNFINTINKFINLSSNQTLEQYLTLITNYSSNNGLFNIEIDTNLINPTLNMLIISPPLHFYNISNDISKIQSLYKSPLLNVSFNLANNISNTIYNFYLNINNTDKKFIKLIPNPKSYLIKLVSKILNLDYSKNVIILIDNIKYFDFIDQLLINSNHSHIQSYLYLYFILNEFNRFNVSNFKSINHFCKHRIYEDLTYEISHAYILTQNNKPLEIRSYLDNLYPKIRLEYFNLIKKYTHFPKIENSFNIFNINDFVSDSFTKLLSINDYLSSYFILMSFKSKQVIESLYNTHFKFINNFSTNLYYSIYDKSLFVPYTSINNIYNSSQSNFTNDIRIAFTIAKQLYYSNINYIINNGFRYIKHDFIYKNITSHYYLQDYHAMLATYNLLNSSYQSYQHHSNYTRDQLFFIIIGELYCSTSISYDDYYHLSIITNQSKLFNNAFSCIK